uniref:Uncharacterized protein n=1 Tax=Parascaris equorum TaxID=6256 RepID=A0A914S8S6_PAREQ
MDAISSLEVMLDFELVGIPMDAIDLFLGNFRVDPDNLPPTFETTVLSFDYHGGAIIGAIFAAAMTILCVLVAELSSTITYIYRVVYAD